jgi:hypothetical protein
MVAAMADVRQKKLTLHQSSVVHGVPRSTLSYRMKTDTDEFKAAYVRETVIGYKNEDLLVERIIRLQRVGFGLTANDIRRMAFEFAVRNNTPKASLFNAEKKIAGWDWYSAFMERHPDISLRKSQAISFARAQCMNRPQVYEFFNMLGVELDSLSLRQSPQAIYNMDESGLHLHFRPGKVLAAKGDRSVLQVTQSERAENVTVVACCSAAGHFIPPQIIYKGKRNKAEFADNLPPGSSVAMSDSGYITTDIFLNWLQHFNQHKVPGKVILLLDGHSSHVKSIAVIDLAVSYNITMVCLPPHTTHYLQPLDRAFFRPLKVHYDSACRTFLSNHPGRPITKLQFGSLLSEAWGRAATPGTASNGFRACGIFPLNKNAIPDNAFMPSTVSDVPLTDASTVPASGGPAVTAPATAELPAAVLSTAGLSVEIPFEPTAIRSTSPVTQLVTQIVTQIDPVVSLAVSSTPRSTKATSMTFAMLHPTPKINRIRRTGANRTTQKAAVLTSPAYRLSLSDKLESSDNNKKTATTARRRLSKAKKGAPATEKSNPNKKTKSKAKASSSKKSNSINNAPKMVNYYCGGCGELYDNSRSNWLRCVGCLEWWEIDCSGMLGKSREEQDQFRCPDCE